MSFTRLSPERRKLAAKFIRAVVNGEKITAHATGDEDKARQWARRNGFVEFDRSSWSWKALEKGRTFNAALEVGA